MTTALHVVGQGAAIVFVVLLVAAMVGVVAGSILGPAVGRHVAEGEAEEAPAPRVKVADRTRRPGTDGDDGVLL